MQKVYAFGTKLCKEQLPLPLLPSPTINHHLMVIASKIQNRPTQFVVSIWHTLIYQNQINSIHTNCETQPKAPGHTSIQLDGIGFSGSYNPCIHHAATKKHIMRGLPGDGFSWVMVSGGGEHQQDEWLAGAIRGAKQQQAVEETWGGCDWQPDLGQCLPRALGQGREGRRPR